jgi:hypothetical protein
MKHKTDAPMLDHKAAPPTTGDWQMSSLSDLVEQTNLGSTGVKEVLNASTPQEVLTQTITHPVILAVVVAAVLLLMR